MEGEQPPSVKRVHRRRRGSRIAALFGVLVGLGLIVGIGYVLAQANLFDGGGSASAGPSASTETEPPKPVLRIVFPEGFTRAEMARRIAAVNEIAVEKRGITPSLRPGAYLAASENLRLLPPGFSGSVARNLEGFLFPATYSFTEDTISEELVDLQLEAFNREWAKVDLNYAKSKNLTPYDVLIIASMIEKEVQAPKERSLVSAVIYNRLKARMPLGIDATIRYGLDIPPTKAITQSQLESNNPYNTRTRAGLPPTPISNPGLAAMQAAAHPAKVDYLYFVRKADCKSHFFTRSERKFLDYPRAGLQCG